jgi:outer membrane protein TolC
VSRRIAGGALCCALAGVAGAQSVSSPLPAPAPAPSAQRTTTPLADAAEAAWQRAVRAQEVDGQALRARADRAVADSLWAAPPVVELSHRDDRLHTAAGRRETEVGLVWPIWLPGQRSARGAAADTEIDLARAAVQAGRLFFAGLVRDAAWTLAGQRADVDLADDHVRYLQNVASDVDRRVQAGDLARADALAARAEWLAAQAALASARQRYEASRAQWRVLTGLEDSADPAESSPAPQRVAFGDHPDARVALLAAARARARLDLVNVSRRDPPEVILRTRQETPGRAESSLNSIGIGVRIPLGTNSRNLPLQAAALAELNVAETTVLRVQERIDADIAIARASLDSVSRQLDAERARASLLRERAGLLDTAFKAGETPLPELLRALAAAAQADNSLARQQAALGLARARLQHALGILP